MPVGAALAWDDDRCDADDHLGGEGTYLVDRIRGSRRKQQ
jgi:hypothetical protein